MKCANDVTSCQPVDEVAGRILRQRSSRHSTTVERAEEPWTLRTLVIVAKAKGLGGNRKNLAVCMLQFQEHSSIVRALYKYILCAKSDRPCIWTHSLYRWRQHECLIWKGDKLNPRSSSLRLRVPVSLNVLNTWLQQQCRVVMINRYSKHRMKFDS